MRQGRPLNSYMGIVFHSTWADWPRIEPCYHTQAGKVVREVLVLRTDASGEVREELEAISDRKYKSKPSTVERRQESVERVREAAALLGWTLSDDERELLETYPAKRKGKDAA